MTTSSQVNPFSILQSAEQPSPLTVLPSSHSCPLVLSTANKRPSPHAVAQGPPVVGHIGPRRQNDEQPSPLPPVASSHCSDPSLMPLPHTVVVHVVGPTQPAKSAGGCVHIQPSGSPAGLLSRRQTELHPSPSTVLPSSHCSFPASTPS